MSCIFLHIFLSEFGFMFEEVEKAKKFRWTDDSFLLTLLSTYQFHKKYQRGTEYLKWVSSH